MKKGQTETLTWLVDILKGILEVVLVLAIVATLIAVVWRATLQDQDKDFKRILDATNAMIEDFQDKNTINTQITVPAVSEEPYTIRFYPAGGKYQVPKCKGKTCLCMYYPVGDTLKETCKTIETEKACKPGSCGEELCAGEYKDFTIQKGNAVNIAINCTSQGSILTVEKVI